MSISSLRPYYGSNDFREDSNKYSYCSDLHRYNSLLDNFVYTAYGIAAEELSGRRTRDELSSIRADLLKKLKILLSSDLAKKYGNLACRKHICIPSHSYPSDAEWATSTEYLSKDSATAEQWMFDLLRLKHKWHAGSYTYYDYEHKKFIYEDLENNKICSANCDEW